MRWLDLIKIKREKKKQFHETLNKGGVLAAVGRAKYLGGHPDLIGERTGKITVNSQGLFFRAGRTFDYIFIPVDKISAAEFKTGEQIANNAAFARLLAIGGFAFAYKRNLIDKHMFLTVSYYANKIENTVLFEAKTANIVASALAKIRQEFAKSYGRSSADLSPIELLKQISELRTRGVLTAEEYAEKKKELLSRI